MQEHQDTEKIAGMRNNAETRRLVLMLIALLSTPACLGGGVIFSYFWYAVISNRSAYVERVFEVSEIARVRYGPKIRCEVAVGRIGSNEESLYGWRDYFKADAQRLQANGRRVSVMYNPQASRFHFSGRNLRVLSLNEFKTARRRLFQWVAFGAISPILWAAYYCFGRRLQKERATKWAAHESA